MPAKKKATPEPAKLIGVPWKFSEIWNHTLDNEKERPYIPRDYMYASELGGSYCDRYLKMYGVRQTNPPNVRSKRKFQAGNTWEWVLGIVMLSSGLMKKKQIRVESKLPRMLRVSGRLDFVVGGDIDWKAAHDNVKKTIEGLELLDLDVPPFFFNAIEKFIDKYSGKLLREVVLETKSCSSFIMERIQKTGLPQAHHVNQLFHYIHGNEAGITEGKLIYVCKDDCIMEEFDVKDDERFMEAYVTDIKLMTKYYNAGFNPKKPLELIPPKEPLFIFDEGVFKFAKNWKVEYSPFLTLLYGYETPEAYRKEWQYKMTSWSRVFKRFVKGENITPKNREVEAEAKMHMPKWDKYVAMAKAAGAFQESEEAEDGE